MLKLFVVLSLSAVGLCAAAGGYSDVTDAAKLTEYKTLLATVQNDGDLTFPQNNGIQEIQNIEQQVVAGLNIKYSLLMTDGTTCEVVIFVQVWTNTRQVHNHCLNNKRNLGGMPGGYFTQTDPESIKNYTLMLTKLNSGSQLSLSQDFTVEKVETQVVAGVNIRYTLTINGATCHVTVFDQEWTNTRKVTYNDCPTIARRQLFGGFNPVSVNDPNVQKCLEMSVDRVNAMSNSMYRMLVSNTVSARQQVVAGMNYEVNFQTQMTECMKGTDKMTMLGDCPTTGSNTDKTMWKGLCYLSLDQTMSVSNVKMNVEYKVDNTDVQLDNNMQVDIKPVSDVKLGLKTMVHSLNGEAKDQIKYGLGRLRVSNTPVVSLLRKKRGLNNLMNKLDKLGKGKDIDHIIETGKSLIGGGDDHDVLNHLNDLFGQDGHDMIKHGQAILGGDGHDLVNHVTNILGGDGHDLVDHGKKLLGGDDHDLKPHGNSLIGGDDHDLKPHGNSLIGGDDHDLKPHGNSLIGGDDHDLKPHGNSLIGGDDHDLKPHGNNLIGGDDHDLKPHGNSLIGGDDHDFKPHENSLIGGDDHDLKPHGNSLIGGDDHDLKPHGNSLIGGDDHDLKPHGNKLIGGDDHDLKPHGNSLIGGDDHDLKPHGTNLIGGDGLYYCHIGMFREFKAKFNKLYGSSKEEEKRYNTFCDNMRTVRKLQETEKGTAVYGATKFADLTKEEFQQYVGKKWDLRANLGMKRAAIPKDRAPDAFDWREHSAVTPVKNQGSCGSCWAFSTTGNIEGQWAIKKKNLISLSEQELVDCDKVDEGCNGGLPSQAYKEIERLGGLESEKDYSYKGEDEKCDFKKRDVRVYINDSVSISSDETEMASWLAANGPISIGINAFAMQFYMGGISHPWKIFCNPKDLDHGVLIVGYGVQDDKPYWIVKNSWGEDWGEKGYYLVYRGDGVCGLNAMCTSAVVN